MACTELTEQSAEILIKSFDKNGDGVFRYEEWGCALLPLICVIGLVWVGPGPPVKPGHKHTLGALRASNVRLCSVFSLGRRPRTSPDVSYDTHKRHYGTSSMRSL